MHPFISLKTVFYEKKQPSQLELNIPDKFRIGNVETKGQKIVIDLITNEEKKKIPLWFSVEKLLNIIAYEVSEAQTRKTNIPNITEVSERLLEVFDARSMRSGKKEITTRTVYRYLQQKIGENRKKKAG